MWLRARQWSLISSAVTPFNLKNHTHSERMWTHTQIHHSVLTDLACSVNISIPLSRLDLDRGLKYFMIITTDQLSVVKPGRVDCGVLVVRSVENVLGTLFVFGVQLCVCVSKDLLAEANCEVAYINFCNVFHAPFTVKDLRVCLLLHAYQACGFLNCFVLKEIKNKVTIEGTLNHTGDHFSPFSGVEHKSIHQLRAFKPFIWLCLQQHVHIQV